MDASELLNKSRLLATQNNLQEAQECLSEAVRVGGLSLEAKRLQDAFTRIREGYTSSGGEGTGREAVGRQRKKETAGINRAQEQEARNAAIDRVLRADTKRPEEVLGVSGGASREEIGRAYRELTRLVHPDRNPGRGEEAGRATVAVREAREKLLRRL